MKRKVLLTMVVLMVLCANVCCMFACGSSVREVSAYKLNGKTYVFFSICRYSEVYGYDFVFENGVGEKFNGEYLIADSFVVTFDKSENKGTVTVDSAFYGPETYEFTYTVESDKKIVATALGKEVNVEVRQDFLIIDTRLITGDDTIVYLRLK